jgi:hypothetical protein
VNGVEARLLDTDFGEQELGILVSVKGANAETSKGYLALLRATLLHFGFEGRKATAGNLAFPFSPSDLACISNADNEFITVCGSRDPAFIANHESILSDVAAYVATLSDSSKVEVRFIACGLAGQPRLRVEESVAATLEEATAALPKASAALEQWVCSGGMAADFTVHHLVTMDSELVKELFQIRILTEAEDGTVASKKVDASLRTWAEEAGPVVSHEEATATWLDCSKPKGTAMAGTTVGELAVVVRSKNAGVNEITFDLIFPNKAAYLKAKQSPALDPAPVEVGPDSCPVWFMLFAFCCPLSALCCLLVDTRARCQIHTPLTFFSRLRPCSRARCLASSATTPRLRSRSLSTVRLTPAAQVTAMCTAHNSTLAWSIIASERPN